MLYLCLHSAKRRMRYDPGYFEYNQTRSQNNKNKPLTVIDQNGYC